MSILCNKCDTALNVARFSPDGEEIIKLVSGNPLKEEIAKGNIKGECSSRLAGDYSFYRNKGGVVIEHWKGDRYEKIVIATVGAKSVLDLEVGKKLNLCEATIVKGDSQIKSRVALVNDNGFFVETTNKNGYLDNAGMYNVDEIDTSVVEIPNIKEAMLPHKDVIKDYSI